MRNLGSSIKNIYSEKAEGYFTRKDVPAMLALGIGILLSLLTFILMERLEFKDVQNEFMDDTENYAVALKKASTGTSIPFMPLKVSMALPPKSRGPSFTPLETAFSPTATAFMRFVGSPASLTLNEKAMKPRDQGRLFHLPLYRAGHETQLRMFQAQIEPHFLFNTLANVVSLIDKHPQSAKDMLGHLTGSLRRSLQRTRADISTLAQEAEMLEASTKCAWVSG